MEGANDLRRLPLARDMLFAQPIRWLFTGQERSSTLMSGFFLRAAVRLEPRFQFLARSFFLSRSTFPRSISRGFKNNISSPLRLSGLKPTPTELLRHSAVCYLEHVALLLCTVYAERRHELEEGRRSAAGAPFDFPISKEWRNGYDHIADHYLDYSASWRRLLWTRTGPDRSRGKRTMRCPAVLRSNPDRKRLEASGHARP